MTGKRHAKSLEQAAAVVKRAKAAGLKIAAAESCTGGMLCATLTDISGSSAVLDRGFVTYSNQAKVEMLGVTSNTLAAHGAVSDETAQEMASGALLKSRAQIALSITGIAGPDGGSAKKPVGLVYFGMAKEGGISKSWERHFGDIGRQPIRQAAVEFALELLYEAIPSRP